MVVKDRFLFWYYGFSYLMMMGVIIGVVVFFLVKFFGYSYVIDFVFVLMIG